MDAAGVSVALEQRLLESALRQGEELITLFILPSRACVAVLM